MYSVDADLWNASRLLQGQLTLWIPGGLVLFGAAVRSQWRFMKRGMSEKARKRWVLIWALGFLVSLACGCRLGWCWVGWCEPG